MGSGKSTVKMSRNNAKVRVRINGGRMQWTTGSKELYRSIGGRETLLRIMGTFYKKMFRDKQLAKFVEDVNDPHPERLADWIGEKMTGESLWSSKLRERNVERGEPYDRQSAHFKAWNSRKREVSRRGSHFKLDDAITWMRLMFWAMREEKIDSEHPVFFDWYVEFISHFVAVYERTAPQHALPASEWCLSEQNVRNYQNNGWLMRDVAHLR